MNDETKQQINEKYQRELQRGERFWPDSIFKDLIVSLGLFVLLVLMAAFLGVENSPKADPSDTSYIPRPEWYFLFLFKFLALYGQIPVHPAVLPVPSPITSARFGSSWRSAPSRPPMT